jgi:hypothetical protein
MSIQVTLFGLQKIFRLIEEERQVKGISLKKKYNILVDDYDIIKNFLKSHSICDSIYNDVHPSLISFPDISSQLKTHVDTLKKAHEEMKHISVYTRITFEKRKEENVHRIIKQIFDSSNLQCTVLYSSCEQKEKLGGKILNSLNLKDIFQMILKGSAASNNFQNANGG